MASEPIVLGALGNGVRFVSERVPGRQQVALSITLLRGSRQQQVDENGLAHLLEHMLFKGSASYSAAEINRQGERLGGTLNAFTDRESITLHLTVLAEDLEAAFLLLVELLLRPTLVAAELALERAVVAQEAAMAAEDLEDWLQETVTAAFWGEHPLAWPVLGKPGLIRRVSARRLRAFHAEYLAAAPILIAAVGAVDARCFEDLVKRYFADLPERRENPLAPPPTPHYGQKKRRHSQARQAHLLWMTRASAFADVKHLKELFANHILGAGMASRLFQELRESRGLAYQTYSQLEALSDTGEWSLYAAVPAERQREAQTAIAAILQELAEQGPSAEEMQWGRDGLRKQWMLGQEDLETRMARLVRQLSQAGRLRPEAELLTRLAEISADDLRRTFARVWQERLEWTLLPA